MKNINDKLQFRNQITPKGQFYNKRNEPPYKKIKRLQRFDSTNQASFSGKPKKYRNAATRGPVRERSDTERFPINHKR